MSLPLGSLSLDPPVCMTTCMLELDRFGPVCWCSGARVTDYEHRVHALRAVHFLQAEGPLALPGTSG